MAARRSSPREVQEKIVTAIRAGNYAQVAAVYAGIGERTFFRWMELGEEAKAGRYRQFWQAVKAAEGEAEVRAVAIIQRKMPDDWRAAMSYLERKHPKRWGRRVDVTSGDEPFAGIRDQERRGGAAGAQGDGGGYRPLTAVGQPPEGRLAGGGRVTMAAGRRAASGALPRAEEAGGLAEASPRPRRWRARRLAGGDGLPRAQAPEAVGAAGGRHLGRRALQGDSGRDQERRRGAGDAPADGGADRPLTAVGRPPEGRLAGGGRVTMAAGGGGPLVPSHGPQRRRKLSSDLRARRQPITAALAGFWRCPTGRSHRRVAARRLQAPRGPATERGRPVAGAGETVWGHRPPRAAGQPCPPVAGGRWCPPTDLKAARNPCAASPRAVVHHHCRGQLSDLAGDLRAGGEFRTGDQGRSSSVAR